MDEKEILARCEAVITEVDIEIMEWHHQIDLMAFIGQEVPLVLYTGDARVEVGTARLVHDDGALKMTGEITAELAMFNDQPGHYSLDSYSIGFDTENKQLTAVSLAPKAATAHFRIGGNGTIEQFVDLRGTARNTDLPFGLEDFHPDKLREKIRAKIDEALYKPAPPKHPYFADEIKRRLDEKEND